ncbi:MAG: SGNH/GDSL hydrolase family protein [Nitrospirae bacterium]|nr:SGNH/GDSL hydrolase family protein [Nitrospirota bacterium]
MGKKKRFLSVLLYVIFLIIVIEGSARIAFLMPEVSSGLWEDEDYWWRRMWVQRHQNSGNEIFYKFDIYDPSKGWISKPNLRDMKVFGNKVLNTNSKGFRGKKDYSYDKDQNRVRILIFGDSFTFGDEVSDNETYSYYLQEMLPNIEVINMGVHGYGHDQMLILLREEGIRYKPDIVIIGFLPMDMSRNLLRFRDYAKPKFIFDDGTLKTVGVPVPSPDYILKWDWATLKIFHIYSIFRHRYMESTGLLKKEQEEITAAILNEIIKVTDNINAVPVFVYLPSGNEITDKTRLTQDERFFFSMCQTNNKAKCFSLRPYFSEKITKGAAFNVHGHWGPEGHLAAADAIKRYLIEGGYVVLP